MIKKSLLLTLLLALLVPWAAFGQGTLPIGTGTTYSSSGSSAGVGAGSPMGNTYYYCSTAQFIYTAEELGGAKTINSLAFNHNGFNFFSSTVNIYLTHTTASTVDVNSPATSGTLVYTGTGISLGGDSAGWQTFNFSSNFEYNGTDNLLVVVCRTKSNSGYSNGQGWQYTETTDNKFMVRSSDTGTYGDITNTSNSYTASTKRPNIIIGYVLTTPYITLDPTSATVITGFTQTLTATVGNVSGTPTITYESNDTHVATVEGSGTTATVTGVAPGTATITATMNYQGTDYTATCAITVEDPSLCSPTFSNPSDDYISNFTTTGGVTNISNSSTYETGGYSDYYDTQSASIEAGETLSCTVTPSSTEWSYGNAIWVDWNGDLVFADNERVAYSAVVSGEWTGEFAVPATTAAGDYHMRVMHYYNTAATDPCISANYGEAEDYKLTVLLASSCSKPSNLAVSEIGKRSAKLSWTENGEATAWQICLNGDEDHLIDADTNPYTLTGLDPETDYTVKVRANCSSEPSNWSNEIPFTTEVACPTPTNLTTSNITANSAVIAWTGNDDATSYNLRYATGFISDFFEDFENGIGQWIVIRSGEGDGNTDWHVVNSNTIFSNEAIPAHSGNYVVMSRSYNGSAYNVDNWLISPQVNLGGTMTYWVMDDSQYHEHYDIYVSTTTTDLSAFTKFYEPGDASGEWTEVTVDLSAYAGQQGYVAFRNTDSDQDFIFIDDITITFPSTVTVDWTTVNNAISPYTIEGLTPETNYSVEVQAVYADGISAWASTTFTTLALDAIPLNLQADVMATKATLTWDGAQDSYNVRYRSVYYYNSFNTDEDRAGWSYSSAIYGVDDTVYDIPGSSNFFLAMGWSTTAEEVICSPELPAYPSGSTLEFYHFYYSTANTFQVGYSTTTNDADAFTWSDPISSVSVDDAYTAKFSQVLPDGVKYVAFKATASEQAACIFIDNFKIYKGAANNEWEETVSNVNARTLAITGLTPETEYEWQVQGNMTNGTTEWSERASFTTLALSSYTLDIVGFGDGNISWYLISSPIGAVNPTNVENMLRDNAEEYDLYAFDQAYPREEWRNYSVSNFILEPGKGYLYANQDNVTLTFTGDSYSGDGVVTLSKDDNAYPSMLGWNLVGNPFGETAYIDRPFYVMNPQQRWKIIPATSNVIQPMQGVFVHAEEDGETMTFSTTAPDATPTLALNLCENSNVVDRAIVNFDGERSLPKFQLNESSTKVYIPMEDQDYAVVSAGNVGELPVSFKAESNGSYTLNFTSQEVSFSYLHLIDNMTGDDVNLLETPYYTFNAQTTDYANRFRLVFATGSSTDGDSFGFINGAGNLSIFGIEGEATVQVVDVLGHVLSSETFSGSYERKLNVAPGVYMVRLIQGNDVKVQKMVIR